MTDEEKDAGAAELEKRRAALLDAVPEGLQAQVASTFDEMTNQIAGQSAEDAVIVLREKLRDALVGLDALDLKGTSR